MSMWRTWVSIGLAGRRDARRAEDERHADQVVVDAELGVAGHLLLVLLLEDGLLAEREDPLLGLGRKPLGAACSRR